MRGEARETSSTHNFIRNFFFCKEELGNRVITRGRYKVQRRYIFNRRNYSVFVCP